MSKVNKANLATRASTKHCPNCNDIMTALYSTDEKMCPSCATVIKWPLEEGQKKVFDNTICYKDNNGK